MKKFTSILLTVLILSLFAGLALGSSSSSETTVTPAEGTQTEDKKDTNETEQKEENKQVTVKVGEVLTTDQLKITFVSCEDYVEKNQFLAPKDGNKFIKLTLEAENIGKSDAMISTFEFKCYADGMAMDSTYREDDLSATLSAGRKVKGGVYFEVPKDAASIEVEYETNFWSDKKAIFVVK